jgi:hypothetical protein
MLAANGRVSGPVVLFGRGVGEVALQDDSYADSFLNWLVCTLKETPFIRLTPPAVRL